MCCGEQCHPGFQDLELTLPVAVKAKTSAKWKRAFDRVRTQQPVEPSKDWSFASRREGETFIVTLNYGGAGTPPEPGRLQLFPDARLISSDNWFSASR